VRCPLPCRKNNTDPASQRLLPFSQHVRALPAGWLIPIVILIIISFPPLFGHEIIALLCGVVYGLGIGFGIVAAGTFIGESTLRRPQSNKSLAKRCSRNVVRLSVPLA